MSASEDLDKSHAASANTTDEIARYVHDPSPQVIRALLGNRNLREDDVLIIAQRRNLTPDILEAIYKDKRWSESYPIRLALARNPKCPLSVSLSIARYLRLFDLEEITRSHFIPLVFRHKIEAIITERVPTMPLGNKKTLAKKATGNVLLKLLQDSDAEVVRLCLNNPHMIEAHLFKILARKDILLETTRLIGEHPTWSSRSLIRLSLLRNEMTPLSLSVRFLRDVKLIDLRELYADPSVPVTIRPFIHRELLSRGEEPKKVIEEVIFEIDEEEIAEIEAEGEMPHIDADTLQEGSEPT